MDRTVEIDDEVERKLTEKALANAPCDGKDGDHNAVLAEDTVEETAMKRKICPEYSAGAAIDVNNAEWNREYVRRGDRNLERFKELGLYRHLQDLGILYDERQFKRNYSIGKAPSGKQMAKDAAMDSVSYEDVERQFDEIDERLDEAQKRSKGGKTVADDGKATEKS